MLFARRASSKSCVLSFVMTLTTSLALLVPALSFADSGNFPKGPDAQTTPGSLCTHPDQYRYPEHVPYCIRNVDTKLKYDIIREYDQKLGYHISQMERSQFKIDHYIPLCMGGSNERDNLWPQHSSVYNITDPLEPVACDKMAKGRLKQAKAIEMIKFAKAHLDQAEDILHQLESL